MIGPDLFPAAPFEPTPAAALARVAIIRPAAYARTRNHLDGAVTRLSPYLTHGFLSTRDVLRHVLQRHQLDVQHKLVYELGWRDYFHHVWQHLGDGIFTSLHEGPLPDQAYARELPVDIRQGATGVPVIDRAVRSLYATGWLHNHARMWLASYVVHLRKVHWRAGADWMYGHLLDGDLASNHLSWQWVAGTGSHKPYLFNADNVARHAAAQWHSAGSVVDVSYETLDRMARSATAVAGGRGEAVEEPALLPTPPAAFGAPDAGFASGRDVHLVHPWSLGSEGPAHALRIGFWPTAFNPRWSWSDRRRQFVVSRMREFCQVLWASDAQTLLHAIRSARTVTGLANPHLPAAFETLALHSPAPLFVSPERRCASFSQFWSRVTRGLENAGELLH